MKYCLCGISNSRMTFIEGLCVGCYAKGIRVVLDEAVISADMEKIKKFNDKNRKSYRVVKAKVERQKKDKTKPPCVVCGKKEIDSNNPIKRGKHINCVRPEVCRVCRGVATEQNLFLVTKRNGKCKIHVSCRKSNKKERLTPAEKIAILPELRLCIDCGEMKNISQFYIRAKQGDVYDRCKKCHGKKTKQWREEHQEKVKEYNREYHKTYDRNSSKGRLPTFVRTSII